MNNLLRSRRSPFSPRENIIRANESSHASKPNKLPDLLKTRNDHQITHKCVTNEETSGIFEDYPMVLPSKSKGGIHDETNNVQKTLPFESSSSLPSARSKTDDETLFCDMTASIFRRKVDCKEQENDTMKLKRANPIYDSDDNDDYTDITLKRRRTNTGTIALQWDKCLDEDRTEGFCLMNLLRD